MKCAGHIRFLSPLLAAAALLLAGCAPTREASAPVRSPSYAVARDGGFAYRIPPGWFDASADSQAQGHAALLIRNDYRATIAVDEVHLDDAARSELRRNGLVVVARLLLSLSSWDHNALLTMTPRMITLGDREVCRYGLESANDSDMVEVTLVESGERLYAVRVLVSGAMDRSGEPLRAVQDEFLRTLRW